MACVFAVRMDGNGRHQRENTPWTDPGKREGSIWSRYPLQKSNKISFSLKKANQARYEYLVPKGGSSDLLCGFRDNGMTTPCPPNRSCWMSCQFAFVLDLAVIGHAHSAVTLSFPSWKQYNSRKSSPKAIQVPLLALVGRAAHGQCGQPCATDISLWSLATRRALWPDVSAPNRDNPPALKEKICILLGYPKPEGLSISAVQSLQNFLLVLRQKTLPQCKVLFFFPWFLPERIKLSIKSPRRFISLFFSF